MKEAIKFFAIFLVLPILLAVLCCYCEGKSDEILWNEGHCQCGGEWHFSNAEHIRNGGDVYYYHCQECGDVIRLYFSHHK